MKQSISLQRVPFTQVANNVLADKRLKLREKGLFAYLYSKPENWDFSFKRIAQDSDDGDRVVLASLKSLEKHGYLKRTRLSTGKVSYDILFDPNSQNVNQAQKAQLTFPQLADRSIKSNKELNTTNKEGSTPRLSRQDLIESFSIFWGVYPRKVAKPMALRAWLKIKPSIELTERILQGVRNHQAGKQWQEDGGRFIPHPATFLNQQRWEDEVEEKQNLSVLHL